MRVCRWLWVLLGLLPGCREAARAPAAGVAGPLPPALARLLAAARPPAADVAALQAQRAQWAGDSLGRLLVHHRLAHDFGLLGQADSAFWHLRQAWRAVGPAQGRRYPREVADLGGLLGPKYYKRAAYDSARACLLRGVAVFRAAGLDSLYRPRPGAPGPPLLNGLDYSGGLTLASAVAHLGMVSRRLGDLATAVRYYERAALLYQRLRMPAGSIWMQCLTGEAYAEQNDATQARAAYEQALRAARLNLARQPAIGPAGLLGVVLDYYEPLLLAAPHPPAYASQLAREMAATLRRAPLRTSRDTILLTQGLAQLMLIPVEVALRNGQPARADSLAAAERWLRRVPAAARTQPEAWAAQARVWGLRAWQQHPTHPAAARRLLSQAIAQLSGRPVADWQARSRQQLVGYCLAMHEPAVAQQLLVPLVPLYQRPRSPLPLSQVTGLLAQAYAGLGRYDSAYRYARRTQALTDSLRAGHQFAALAAAETRYRTREQASQIALLTERGRQQATRARLAAAGAALLATLLLLLGLSWRSARRLNRQLAAQAAQLTEQARRLGELDAAKNQFFANVSHELRTPLTLVLGPLQQALALVRPAAPRELLATSLRHAQRLRTLIDRILDLTKLEAGKLPVALAATPLAGLLAEAIGQFAPLAATGDVRLRGPEGVPPALTLLLDAEKVGQILTNLLANAVHHTPPGGQVALHFAQPAPDRYALTVQDTGPGIAVAEQARLFERYYQSPQRQARGGTGLGLALSRELAELLGGTLTLRSTPGQGAAFTLTLPAERLPSATPAVAPGAGPPPAQPEAAAAPPPLAPPARPAAVSGPAGSAQPARLPGPARLPAPARPRLLLVEDEAELRAYVRGLLAPHYEVLEAPDGQQALDVLAATPVELVVSDAMMPRLSGLELLHALKADPAHQQLPFLMVTARADEAHRLAALTVGVDDYLTKPFEADELLARVRTLLLRRQVRLHCAALPADEPAPAGLAVVGAPAAGGAGGGESGAGGPAADPALLARWQTQVAPHLADPAFGPDELAAHLLLSRRTLYRRLGELTGLTPAAWLRELRLHHARQLLEAGRFTSLAAVAEAAGFASTKYFSQLYTERFGRRPSDYGNG